MIEALLHKAGAIHLSRLGRILAEACQLAGREPPSVRSVAESLLERAYLFNARSGLFIAKPDFMFPNGVEIKTNGISNEITTGDLRYLWCLML